MSVKIAESWKKQLESEFEKEYFKLLTDFVKEDIQNNVVYPSEKLIFNAFEKCSFDDMKVVILGQDPYHGKGQANGLSFSVNDGVRIPPSLKNIFKEINADLGKEIPESGNLERWAEQGVLLLNSILTVRSATPGSHQKKGWETFTDTVIETISNQKENVVFMLWGKYAQQKGAVIDKEKHFVLESAHPSPFSAHKGFLGNQHFSKANDYLKSNQKEEIEW
ncbi:MAG: uracil-DNA glycosylase [Arenicella sp.]|jgi:uracil-DNA glycosylase